MLLRRARATLPPPPDGTHGAPDRKLRMTAHIGPTSVAVLPVRGHPRARSPLAGSASWPAGTSAISVTVLAAALTAQVVVPDLVAQAGTAVAIIGIVIGIPHGAVDHMVPFWLADAVVTPRALLDAMLRYLAVAAMAVGALLVIPTVTVSVFLLASAVHFGRGDVVFAAERAGRPSPPLRQDRIVALAHGAAVVVLPVALWNAQSAAVFAVIAPRLAGTPPSWVVPAVVGAVAVLVAVAGAILVTGGRWRQAAELALVVAVFVTVPPLVAFGVYFGGWHALRHTCRLLALPGPGGHRLRGPVALRRYAVHAAGPSAVALATLVAVDRLASPTAVPMAIAGLLALTFPHLHTVAVLDRNAAIQTR